MDKNNIQAEIQLRNGGKLSVVYSAVRLRDLNSRPEGMMIVFQPK